MIRYSISRIRLLASVLLSSFALAAQQTAAPGLGDNAALRYWSAFAQMRDSPVSPDLAKELRAILDGTAPYSDAKYGDLVEQNRAAVETLQRGAQLARCDWGLEYQLGSETPIEYVRKALALGRLNVLSALRQLQRGDRSGGIRALSSGIRFSHDVGSGGPLLAALAAKTLLAAHFRALDFAVREKTLSPAESALVSSALGRIGAEGVDWQAAIEKEFEVLGRSGSPVPAAVQSLYRQTLQNTGQLSQLQQAIANSPKAVSERIANPQRVVDQKRELLEQLQAMRAILR